MRYVCIFSFMALAGLAGCSMNSTRAEQGAMGQNTTKTMAPANDQASKPGNAGNGLGYGMNQEEAMNVFNSLDANHDGVVSREEFMVNGDSGQRFPGCDSNGDGKLTQAEFLQCAEQPASNGH